MKYHCGWLDDDPMQNRSYAWMMRGRWGHPQFPADVRREIAAFVHMPGFQDAFFHKRLKTNSDQFNVLRDQLPSFEDAYEDVCENWLSVTRDDAIKLCHLRGGKAAGVPVIVQLQVMKDLASGHSYRKTAAIYGITEHTIRNIRKRGISVTKMARPLPPGFELLTVVS